MTKKLLVMLAAAVAPAGLLVGSAGPSTAAQQDVVRTDAGLVASKAVGDARVFDGIPYGAPPVGALRWKAPHSGR
jgi:para-nitrobenzyl esterase